MFYYDPGARLPWAWDVVCTASSETRRSMIRDAFPGITDDDLVRASQRLDQVCLERALPRRYYGAAGQVATDTSTPLPMGWIAGAGAAGLGLGVLLGWYSARSGR